MQCTIFTDTSSSFILLQTRFRPSRAQKMFREKYIRCRYSDCVYRALQWNILYFFVFCFCFTILFLSTVGFVSFRRSRVGSSTAQRKYFLCGFECIAERYIKAYIETRQTKRTPTGQKRDFSTLPSIFTKRLCLQWRRWAPERLNDERKAWRSQFILSSLRLFFSFALKHIKITSSIDSIQSQTVTVEFKNIGAKMMKTFCAEAAAFAWRMQFFRFSNRSPNPPRTIQRRFFVRWRLLSNNFSARHSRMRSHRKLNCCVVVRW